MHCRRCGVNQKHIGGARGAHGSTMGAVPKFVVKNTWEYSECKIAHPLASNRVWPFFKFKFKSRSGCIIPKDTILMICECKCQGKQRRGQSRSSYIT